MFLSKATKQFLTKNYIVSVSVFPLLKKLYFLHNITIFLMNLFKIPIELLDFIYVYKISILIKKNSIGISPDFVSLCDYVT